MNARTITKKLDQYYTPFSVSMYRKVPINMLNGVRDIGYTGMGTRIRYFADVQGRVTETRKHKAKYFSIYI